MQFSPEGTLLKSFEIIPDEYIYIYIIHTFIHPSSHLCPHPLTMYLLHAMSKVEAAQRWNYGNRVHTQKDRLLSIIVKRGS
jgi:hypothetical protein